MNDNPKALVVDLNNFAHYPTLAVGYLVAALRKGGYEVEVVSPLAFRLPTMTERQETRWQYVQRRVFFSTHPAIVGMHDALARCRTRWVTRPDHTLTAEAARVMGRVASRHRLAVGLS